MSEQPDLDAKVHARFRTAFGPPRFSHDKDAEWSLMPAPQAPAISVLLNGIPKGPAVWVFDPNATNDRSVLNIQIKTMDDAEKVIATIHEHFAHAVVQLRRDSGTQPSNGRST